MAIHEHLKIRNEVSNFKFFLPRLKEKFKPRQHTGGTDSTENENDKINKFNMKVQFDTDTITDKNRQCITSVIKHWGLSGYSNVLPHSMSGDSDEARNPQQFHNENRYNCRITEQTDNYLTKLT